MIFTADLFINAIILLIHHRTDELENLVRRILDLYNKVKDKIVTNEGEVFAVYINIINELMSDEFDCTDTRSLDTLLLKYKSMGVIQNDPEIYSRLKSVMLDNKELTEDACANMLEKLENTLVIHGTITQIKRMFSRIANAQLSTASLDKQNSTLSDIKDMCGEVIRVQEEQEAKRQQTKNELRMIELDFTDRDELRNAFRVYEKVAVKNVFKTGLQGLNRALGGGWKLGEAMVIDSLAHCGKFLCNRELIKTPQGWVPIGDLKIGDEVTAWDGTTSKVTGVYPQGEMPLSKVRLIDGRTIDAGEEHLWTYWVNGYIRTGNTAEIRELICKGYEIRIPLRRASPAEIDEYLPIYSKLLKYTNHRGDVLVIDKKYAGIEDVIKGIEAVKVLGGYCIEDDASIIVHLNTSKLSSTAWNLDVNDSIRIKRIEPVLRKEECTCISIDHPDKLYVAGEYIVTHNTLMLLKMARWQITLNKAGPEFKRPMCLFYSLENEVAQNVKLLFDDLWANKYREAPPAIVDEEEAANFIHEEFSRYGWTFVLKRKLGSEFGYHQLVAEYEDYLRRGYTPLMCIIDYMDMMNKGQLASDGQGNHLQIKELYTNMCNYLKSKNCTLVTAHQLNRTAAEVARQSPVGAVKKFDMSMLAGSMDPQREVDVVIYQHIERNSTGQSFLTWKLAKHRYEHTVSEHNKYFAYEFDGNLGILDDVQFQDGTYKILEDKSTQNIYARPKKNPNGSTDDDDYGNIV